MTTFRRIALKMNAIVIAVAKMLLVKTAAPVVVALNALRDLPDLKDLWANPDLSVRVDQEDFAVCPVR